MEFGSRRAAALVGTAVLAVAAGSAGLGLRLVRVPALPLPEAQAEEASATVVSALEGTVTAKRHGRVLASVVAPGKTVEAGDPLIRFEDLPLLSSREELTREIARIREAAAAAGSAGQSGVDRVRESGREVRLAALRQIENSYDAARKEFPRWETLFNEGLIARVEFEEKAAELSALGERLREGRATATQVSEEQGGRDGDTSSPALRRYERLLQRLMRLSGTFVVRSPWNGVVREVHVQQGEVPVRGAPLVTLSRASLRRLETELRTDAVAVAVRSACGIPGPFPFTLRDRVLAMPLPPSEARLGEDCRMLVLTRQRPE